MNPHGVLLAALLLAYPLPATAAQWIERSADCIARAAASEAADAWSVPIATACPAVADALAADPWSTLLLDPPGEVTLGALPDLVAVAERHARPSAGTSIDPRTLDGILESLPTPVAEEAPSVWERFWRWLSEQLGDEEPPLPGWLEELSVSEQAAAWIRNVSLIVIAALALAVVINEIRHHRRRRAPRRPGQRAGEFEAAALVVDTAPRGALAGVYESVVAQLQAQGLLPTRPSLTHREVAAAPGVPAGQRDLLGTLSRAAERAAYGGWQPGAAEVDPHLDAGRRLLHGLVEMGRQP